MPASWFFPSLETAETYQGLLEEAGFTLFSSEDVGHEYIVAGEVGSMEDDETTFLQGVALMTSQDVADRITSFGQEHYRTTLELQKLMLYIAQGKVRIGRFVCNK